MSWDDLHILLAVAEEGSLAGAGRRLGVNHTTVLRRLAVFEEQHGVRVFDRLTGGYVPTPAGTRLIAAARSMAATVTEAERLLAGQDIRLEGSIRVTATDTLSLALMPGLIAAFRRRHPDVTVDLVGGNQVLNLSERDADVAIRATPTPPDHLVGRQVCALKAGVYAATPGPVEAAGDWVGGDDSLRRSSLVRALTRHFPGAKLVARSDSVVNWREMAAAGLGQAILPCYLADPDPRLHRRSLLEDFHLPLWILTHPDLRRTARIAAFTGHAFQYLSDLRDLLEGRSAQMPET